MAGQRRMSPFSLIRRFDATMLDLTPKLGCEGECRGRFALCSMLFAVKILSSVIIGVNLRLRFFCLSSQQLVET